MPGRPLRRRTVPAAAPPRRRRPMILVGAAIVLAGVLGALAAANLAGTGRTGAPAPRTAGEIARSQFLLVRLGASRTQVRALLGTPRSTIRRDGRDCWLYDPRSGRRGAYRLCFTGNVLREKTTVPR